MAASAETIPLRNVTICFCFAIQQTPRTLPHYPFLRDFTEKEPDRDDPPNRSAPNSALTRNSLKQHLRVDVSARQYDTNCPLP